MNEPVGWIRALVRQAKDAAEDLYALDADMHEPDPACTWCRRRRRLSRAAKMAEHQLNVIEMKRLRKAFALRHEEREQARD